MIDQGAQLIFATSDDMKDGMLLGAEQHPDVPMIWSSGDSAWADGRGLPGRPDQPRQHHGADGVRQDDRRLRRRPHHRDGQARLPGPADQRRDPAPGQLGLPGRQVLLGRATGARTRPTSSFGVELDRLLVQHPRLHAGSDAGGQRLLRRGRRRGDLRHRHHRGPGRGRAACRRRRGRVGDPLRLPGRLRRGSRRLPGCAVLQLGPGLPADRRVGDRRHVRGRRSSGSGPTGPTSTTPTRRASDS